MSRLVASQQVGSTAPASRPPSVIQQIADRRRGDIARELGTHSMRELRRAAEAAAAARDAIGPLLRPGLHLIAELKRRSPSAGALAPDDADLAARARAYEAGGASILSVLVEPHWFAGSVDDLRAVRAATTLPILAKEFVVDPRQLPFLRAAGADVVLLLANLHAAPRLRRLVDAARDTGLEPLVEVHDARELDRALASGARLIGVNSRDLRTLRVDLGVVERLRRAIPDDLVAVAESGVRDPATLRRWRALGYDAALVGEALMSGGGEANTITARVRSFVTAGRAPTAVEDPASAARQATVKICGVTDRAGVAAARTAGADAIGLNFVPGTRRALSEPEASELVAAARAPGAGDPPRVVGIFADRDPAEINRIAGTLSLDAVQLSGREDPETVAQLDRPAWKVLHVPSVESDRVADRDRLVERTVERGRAFLACGAVGLLLDTEDPGTPGGTGTRSDPAIAAGVARRLPLTLAGGLDPASVAGALRTIPATGVDVASGVEADPRAPRPVKDPVRVGLFVKRARAARLDLPTLAVRPAPVHPGLLEADERGRWGIERQFGGRFVPETLVAALVALERAWADVRNEPAFWAELRERGRRYVGRPTPIYPADRLAGELARLAGLHDAQPRLYLKREDLAHTGAHKINNALGQALLTRRLGKDRVIAETGAGQHGVATATACALLDLACVVYMGAEDVRRQAPNVLRMRALGAEVREVHSGSATLKDAINEAMRDWVTNVATTHYVLGSAVGPHPYPTMVRDLQRVIGDEAAAQLLEAEGRLPDAAVACVGGGSNAIGLLARFIGEPSVRLVGVEAAGDGMATGRHAAALAGGTPGVLHGSRSYLLQDEDGQVTEAHSISAGLDYPGIGPQLSALFEAGRLEILAATDREALDGLRLLARTEGILPALEPAHAISALVPLLRGEVAGGPLPPDPLMLLGLSGRGDKDLGALE